MAEKKRSETTRLLQLEPNLVLLVTAIAIPVIIVGSIVILGTVRSEMNGLVGDELLGGAADDAARHLDSYLLNSLTSVSIMAATPTLHDTVNAANETHQGDPADIEQTILSHDDLWVRSRGALQLAVDIVGTPASEHLRTIQELRPSYEEILLTDRFGALVAATNITSDYYQADESWWQQTYDDGFEGSIYFGQVEFDRSAGAYALDIAVPLREDIGDGSTEVIGVLRALIGAEELFAVINSVKRGESGHALLVNMEDGTVIAGRGPEDVMKRSYDGIEPLRESIREGRGWYVSRQRDGDWLGSYARMPQPSPASYGNWAIVVQQLDSEVNAATQRATLSLILFFAGMVLLVLTISLYLHYKLVKPIREIDLREEMERLTAAESSS